MSAAAAVRARAPGWWGMLLLVATEAALFALLVASYFYIRFERSGPWPQGGIAPPALARPAVMTGLLLAAGAAAYAAARAVWSIRLLLAGTALLGSAFVGLQAWEYVVALDRFHPSDNAYASLFFTITAVHGAHVVAGVLLAAWVLALRPESRSSLEITSLYWIFLPATWVVLFVSLYLSVRL